jgi:hypothetical protein
VAALSGDHEDSSRWHLEALAIAEIGTYRAVQVDALIGLATTARLARDTKAAESYAHQAEQIATKHEFEVQRCRALLVLAALAADDGRADDAQGFGQSARAARDRTGYQPLSAVGF